MSKEEANNFVVGEFGEITRLIEISLNASMVRQLLDS